jgi:hypothetical protein|nr:hypothetical protein [Ferrovum sp.]
MAVFACGHRNWIKQKSMEGLDTGRDGDDTAKVQTNDGEYA